jgi:CRP-like cAMP-binding protein
MAKREADLLARVPLFAGLSKRHLKSVASIGENQAFDQNATIAEEGAPGDVFYVIHAGQAKVIRGGRTVTRLVPGDYFGEIALLDGGPRSASVVTETPVEVMALNRKPFHAMLEREPAIVLKMLEELARRLRNTERKLTS